MSEQIDANRAQWDRRVPIHMASEFYDVEGFKAGGQRLSQVEIDEVGDVAGLSLLHLQCHFGLDTLSWACLGARVVGVDFSEPAIDAARRLSDELEMEAEFVCSDVYQLDLDRLFDVVYTGKGVLSWLPALEPWARVVARHLAPGGLFYIYESHPVGDMYEEREGRLELTYPYFEGPALEFTGTETYAEPGLELPPMVQYEWSHPLSEVVSSLTAAGLQIEFLHEFPFALRCQFPAMSQDEQRRWRLPRDPLPLTFSVRARLT